MFSLFQFLVLKVRFQDPFLFITGLGFGALSMVVDGGFSLFSSIMFLACFRGLYVNNKERKNG